MPKGRNALRMGKKRINVKNTLFTFETFAIFVVCLVVLVAILWAVLRFLGVGIFSPRIQAIVRPAEGNEMIVYDSPDHVMNMCRNFFGLCLEKGLRIGFPPNKEKSIAFTATGQNGTIVSTWILCGSSNLLVAMRRRLDACLSAEPFSSLTRQ